MRQLQAERIGLHHVLQAHRTARQRLRQGSEATLLRLNSSVADQHVRCAGNGIDVFINVQAAAPAWQPQAHLPCALVVAAAQPLVRPRHVALQHHGEGRKARLRGHGVAVVWVSMHVACRRVRWAGRGQAAQQQTEAGRQRCRAEESRLQRCSGVRTASANSATHPPCPSRALPCARTCFEPQLRQRRWLAAGKPVVRVDRRPPLCIQLLQRELARFCKGQWEDGGGRLRYRSANQRRWRSAQVRRSTPANCSNFIINFTAQRAPHESAILPARVRPFVPAVATSSASRIAASPTASPRAAAAATPPGVSWNAGRTSAFPADISRSARAHRVGQFTSCQMSTDTMSESNSTTALCSDASCSARAGMYSRAGKWAAGGYAWKPPFFCSVHETWGVTPAMTLPRPQQAAQSPAHLWAERQQRPVLQRRLRQQPRRRAELRTDALCPERHLKIALTCIERREWSAQRGRCVAGSREWQTTGCTCTPAAPNSCTDKEAWGWSAAHACADNRTSLAGQHVQNQQRHPPVFCARRCVLRTSRFNRSTLQPEYVQLPPRPSQDRNEPRLRASSPPPLPSLRHTRRRVAETGAYTAATMVWGHTAQCASSKWSLKCTGEAAGRGGVSVAQGDEQLNNEHVSAWVDGGAQDRGGGTGAGSWNRRMQPNERVATSAPSPIASPTIAAPTCPHAVWWRRWCCYRARARSPATRRCAAAWAVGGRLRAAVGSAAWPCGRPRRQPPAAATRRQPHGRSGAATRRWTCCCAAARCCWPTWAACGAAHSSGCRRWQTAGAVRQMPLSTRSAVGGRACGLCVGCQSPWWRAASSRWAAAAAGVAWRRRRALPCPAPWRRAVEGGLSGGAAMLWAVRGGVQTQQTTALALGTAASAGETRRSAAMLAASRRLPFIGGALDWWRTWSAPLWRASCDMLSACCWPCCGASAVPTTEHLACRVHRSGWGAAGHLRRALARGPPQLERFTAAFTACTRLMRQAILELLPCSGRLDGARSAGAAAAASLPPVSRPAPCSPSGCSSS